MTFLSTWAPLDNPKPPWDVYGFGSEDVGSGVPQDLGRSQATKTRNGFSSYIPYIPWGACCVTLHCNIVIPGALSQRSFGAFSRCSPFGHVNPVSDWPVPNHHRPIRVKAWDMSSGHPGYISGLRGQGGETTSKKICEPIRDELRSGIRATRHCSCSVCVCNTIADSQLQIPNLAPEAKNPYIVHVPEVGGKS